MVPVVSEVLTGDFHETRTVHNGAYITMHSPGSISMRSMGEPADKYFYHFLRQLTDPDIPAPHPPQQHPMEAIKLQTRVMAEVTIDTEETLDAFVQYTPEPVSWDTAELPEELSRPMLRINYHDDIPEVYSRIVATVGDTAHLFLYPQRVREDAVEIDEDLRERIRGQGLLGCLADPASELAAIHTEYLEEEAE